MGNCFKKPVEPWPSDFTSTELSSNKCDAMWENVHGDNATFAMGPHFYPCARFSSMAGVIRVQVGFAGGGEDNPTYSDPKDHSETVHLEFDPEIISYDELLQTFWDYHDWTLQQETEQYGSIIFCHDEDQQISAEESLLQMLKKTEKPVRTKISTFTNFLKCPDQYQHFLLQEKPRIFERLQMPLNQVGYSHLAAKIEGYVCGYGTPEDFDKERPQLQIPNDFAAMVRKLCVANQPFDPEINKFPL